MSEPLETTFFNCCLNWLGIFFCVEIQIWDGPGPENALSSSLHSHPYLSHSLGMWSCLRITAFRLRSCEMHSRWFWYTFISFSAHWFIAPHESQASLPDQSYLESELECMPRTIKKSESFSFRITPHPNRS